MKINNKKINKCLNKGLGVSMILLGTALLLEGIRMVGGR